MSDDDKRAWTVAEMIALLSTMPADAPVLIDDADTGWTAPPHVTIGSRSVDAYDSADPGVVYLWATYSEMQE